ncbi:MAG: hypothetical protein V9E94_01755 [Microthrixaceae bacterium]
MSGLFDAQHVAGPGEARRERAVFEGADVLVAGELAYLTAVDLLLQRVEGWLVVLERVRCRDVDALGQGDDADGVAHLGQCGDLALEGRIPQVRDRRQLLAAGQR